MSYSATYSVGTFGDEDRIPVGVKPEGVDVTYDTLVYDARVYADLEEGPGELVAKVRIRRVLISKILNDSRDVLYSMDQIDQLEHNVYAAVWDEKDGGYRFDDPIYGDLLIFEDFHIHEGVVLNGFDINQVLDDMTYHVGGGDGLVVFVESYASFVHFNLDGCIPLEGIGYARPGAYACVPVDGAR